MSNEAMMPLPDRIGDYAIAREIGRGGMGVVYLARDTKLDRDVAIKVLPEQLVRDTERVLRFEREAKLLASLNHTNVAAIHGFEECDGKKFLVLEYVEGETLAARIKRGVLPVEDVLEICKQIAEALEAAHEKGIIHRDLKPGNVMVRPDGTVKVLDFGLARAMADDSGSAAAAPDSPTITADFTRPGVVLGTAPYMSPEQARGRPLDKRTDIWSFGVILYECLTGSMLFRGETATDSMGAILHKETDWSLLPPDTPPTVQLLLRRCLTKNRDRRLRDIGDARIELENAIADPTSSSLGLASVALTAAATRPGKRKWRTVRNVAGGLVLAVMGVLLGWLAKPSIPRMAPVFAEIPAPEDTRLIFVGDIAGPVVVSPDGRTLAFIAQQEGKRQKLWLQELDSSEARSLSGTDGASFPFWSPDSTAIGFFVDDKLKRVNLLSGTTTTVCDVLIGRGGTWTREGVILFAPDYQAPIHRVPAIGGKPTPITEVDKSKHTSHRWPFALPDGQHFLFSAVTHDSDREEWSAIYLGSLDGTPPRLLLHNSFNAEFAAGQLLFIREGVLLAAALDVQTAQLGAEHALLVRDVATDLSTWRGAFSASPNGILAYHRVPGDLESAQAGAHALTVSAEATEAVLYDRQGRPTARVAEGWAQNELRISPDGERLAVSVRRDQTSGFDIWLFEETLAPTRVTFMPGHESNPVWSPDGKELAFSHWFGGPSEDIGGIYRKRVGGGTEQLLVPEPEPERGGAWPLDWSSDGRFIVYVTGYIVGRIQTDLWVLPLESGEPVPFAVTPANELGAQFSPNGKWMAYASDESGRFEVYVVPFVPPDGATTRTEGAERASLVAKWQVSVGGGVMPRWRRDGKELFYVSVDGMLMAVAMDTDGESVEVGVITPLFQTSFEPGKTYDVMPDGQEFFFNELSANVDSPISIMVNWQSRLKP